MTIKKRKPDKYGIGRRPYIAVSGDLWTCPHGSKGLGYKMTERAMTKPPVCGICGKYMKNLMKAKKKRS